MNLNIRRRLSLAPKRLPGLGRVFAMSALALVACGGAPDALVVDAPAFNTSQAVAPVHPVTELAGLYTYTNSTNKTEYLGLAIPPANSNDDAEWFAWHLQTVDDYRPWLYHGFFSLSVDGNAQSSSIGITQAKGNSAPSSVSVTLTQTSKTRFTASVTENNVINPTSSSYTAQVVQTGFDFSASALLRDVASDWTGTWFDSGSTFGNRTLQLSAAGSMTGFKLGNCTLDLSLQAATRGNYFLAVATIDPNTYTQSGCEWTRGTQGQAKRLQGIAVVQSSGNGHAQLDMMLLDGTGAGISYRGTR